MHIRFIKNIKVSLTKPDGTKQEKTFRFGECYAATSIQTFQADYVTICLKDGDKIEGITDPKSVFENYNVPTTKVVTPPPKVSPKSTKSTKATKQTKEILRRHNNKQRGSEETDESTN